MNMMRNTLTLTDQEAGDAYTNWQRPLGLGVALVTPFRPDLSLDLEAFARLLDKVCPFVDYCVVAGTTGEGSTLSMAEKALLVAAVAARYPSMPIVLGLGGNNTAALLQEIAATDFSQIKAILSVTPYYSKPSQAGLLLHYSAVANACPVPTILYNVPSRTGVSLALDTLLELAKHPKIIGLKQAHPDVAMFATEAKLVAKIDQSFCMIAGDDMAYIEMMQHGAKGCIGVLPNIMPELMAMVGLRCSEHDFDRAAATLIGEPKLLAINNLLYEEGNPVGVKAALEVQGICAARVRLPLAEASPRLKSKLATLLKHYDASSTQPST